MLHISHAYLPVMPNRFSGFTAPVIGARLASYGLKQEREHDEQNHFCDNCHGSRLFCAPSPLDEEAGGETSNWSRKTNQRGGTKNSSHVVIVTRANYEFHVGEVTLASTLGIDFVTETKTNIVYGLTVGYGF
jgi:hypothetical protein